MSGFLKKIEEEALATLNEHSRKKYAELLKPKPVADESTEKRPLVREWTIKTLTSAIELVEGAPDVKRGANIFAAASCAKCHRVGGRGTLIGPDLTFVGNRFSRRDILESIVHPSDAIAENYRGLQVVTSDGKSFVGRASTSGDYREPTLRLATDPAKPFDVIEIPKSNIEVQRTSPVSWMPEGLLNTFTAEEIRDLLAYVEARGHLD